MIAKPPGTQYEALPAHWRVGLGPDVHSGSWEIERVGEGSNKCSKARTRHERAQPGSLGRRPSWGPLLLSLDLAGRDIRPAGGAPQSRTRPRVLAVLLYRDGRGEETTLAFEPKT
jgi:hypothetical protein